MYVVPTENGNSNLGVDFIVRPVAVEQGYSCSNKYWERYSENETSGTSNPNAQYSRFFKLLLFVLGDFLILKFTILTWKVAPIPGEQGYTSSGGDCTSTPVVYISHVAMHFSPIYFENGRQLEIFMKVFGPSWLGEKEIY